MTGIYKIIINDYYIYIGQSIDIEKRWNGHLNELKRNKHYNKKLQNVFNKYPNTIKFEIIEECGESKLDEREMFYIEQFKSYNTDYGLNMSIGGECVCRKYKTKEEARAALSKSRREHYNTHKEIYKEKRKEYCNTHKSFLERCKEYNKEYYNTHKEKFKQYIKEYNKKHYQEKKDIIIEYGRQYRQQKGILSKKEKFKIRYSLNRQLTNEEWDTWCNTKFKNKEYAIKYLRSLPNINFTIPLKK